MRSLRSAMTLASALAAGCLASQPAPPALTVAVTTPVLVQPVNVAPQSTLQVAANPFGSPVETPGTLRGDVFALPENTTQLPDFSTMRPVASLYTSTIDIPQRRFDQGFPGVADRVEWFGVRYVGSFQARSSGMYHFRMISDDGARLLIDGQQVLINDSVHPPRSAEGCVVLTAGPHHMELDYFQGPRWDIALQLFWGPPDTADRIFNING